MDKSHDIHAAITMASHVQVTLVKFWHAMAGLYFWEYLTTLDYEWKVIRGHAPYRWTIWIYSIARLAALVSVIIFLVTMDIKNKIDCRSWVLFSDILLMLSSSIALLLIVLRTVAIWNKNRTIMILAITVSATSVAFHLHNISLIRSKWLSAEFGGCVPVKSKSSRFSYALTVFADMALLLIILTGLLVLRRRGGATFGLTRILWKQGIIWLVIAFAAEIPLLMFTLLHLNYQLHNLFVSPTHIIVTIAATRVHRALVDVSSGSSGVARRNPQSNLSFSNTKPTDTSSATLDRVEVAIHTAVERHPTGRMRDDDPTIISTKPAYLLPTIFPSPSIPQALTRSI